MATQGRVTARTMTSAVDARTSQYHIMRQNAAGITNVASNPGGDQNETIGVLQNKPNSGQAAAIGFLGETKVVAGGTCTAGALLATNGNGRAIDATSGDFTVGMALEAAAANGEVIRMLLRIPAIQLPTSLNT